MEWSGVEWSDQLCVTFPGLTLVDVPGAVSLWFSGSYSWLCQATDYSNHPQALQALSLSWWFYLSKFIDFLDSIFFLLRGKTSHLSLLHVLHHSTLPAFSWFGPKFAG